MSEINRPVQSDHSLQTDDAACETECDTSHTTRVDGSAVGHQPPIERAVAGRRPGQGAVSAAMMIAGAGLAALYLIDNAGGLPFALPFFWHLNRSLWFLLGIILFVGGWKLVPSTDPAREYTTRPSGIGSVVVYTREGCHLCDDVIAMLDTYRDVLPALQIVDIDRDAELARKFHHCVPVVEIDGRVRFRGQVNEILLRRLIDAHTARSRR